MSSLLSLALSPSARVLVRGVNWLGDAVMSTPALLRLREAVPQAHIALLTHEKIAELWHGHSALNAVLPFSEKESLWRIVKRLRAERFDLGLIFPNSPRSALECFLAGIPQRIGYAGQWRTRLLTHPVAARPGTVKMKKRSTTAVKWLARWTRVKPPASWPASAHHVHQYLHLVSVMGADSEPLVPQLVVHDDEVKSALVKYGLEPDSPNSPLLGLNPGAEYGPAKRWPQDRFSAVAMAMRKQVRCRWILFGGRGDVESANEIAAWIRSVAKAHPGATRTGEDDFLWNVAGQTSLRELCALLKACRVVLTNDTGPMHLAAAVGTPVVVPFGSTSPDLTGPGLPGDHRHTLIKSQAPCAPCFRRECPIDFRCMNNITVEQIVEAVLSRLPRESL